MSDVDIGGIDTDNRPSLGSVSRSLAGAVFDLVSNRRRRAVRYRLSDRDDPRIPIARLTSGVRGIEEGVEDSEAVHVVPYHNHASQLADGGVIEYGPRNGVVVYDGDDRVGPLHGWSRAHE